MTSRAGNVTNAKSGLVFEQGKTYHARATYDAASKSVALVVSREGSVLKTLVFPGTAKGRVIEILPTGLFADFGHFNNQHLPEVSSIGWKFANFTVEIFDN